MLICKQELFIKEVNAGLPNCVPSFRSGPVVEKGAKRSTDKYYAPTTLTASIALSRCADFGKLWTDYQVRTCMNYSVMLT